MSEFDESSVDSLEQGDFVQNLLQQWFEGVKKRTSNMVSSHSFDSLQALESSSALLSKPREALTAFKRASSAQIERKKAEIAANIKSPPFVRLKDKLVFVIGVFLLMIVEYLLLTDPLLVPSFYLLLLPLLIIFRFFDYHSQKMHYFLWDFCYYTQILVVLYLLGRSPAADAATATHAEETRSLNFFYHQYILSNLPPLRTVRMFKWIFALTNGPLCAAIIMWSNSLVFHDHDKMTSFFIHFVPCLVTWSIRWHPMATGAVVYNPGEAASLLSQAMSFLSPSPSSIESPGDPWWRISSGHSAVELDGISWTDSFFMPLGLYIFWQVIYLAKTELVDREKLKKDDDLMTSLRYLTERRPHPLYKVFQRWGWKHSGVLLIVIVQLVYTTALLVPMYFVYEFKWMHALWLWIVFFAAVWRGASYYFESFAKNYIARLEANSRQSKRTQSYGTGARSIMHFTAFFVLVLAMLISALHVGHSTSPIN